MNRGSEWHKWDLHVHTPYSLVNNYVAGDEGDVWEHYISDLEKLPNEIKVLGINDYLFIDGYRKVLEYKKQGRLQNIELLLPVLEFRLDKFGGHRDFKRINFHVIFSNEVNADVIQSQFLNALSSHYKLSHEHEGISWGGVITKANLIELGKQIKKSVPIDRLHEYEEDIVEGFNNLNLKFDKIIEVLQNAPQYFKGKYITAIGKTEWEAIEWNAQSIAEKKHMINSADIIFTAAESVESYQKGYEKLTEARVNNLLLDCSDAHHNMDSSNKDRLGNCNTWIKAELSYEGLKQVLYEPTERLRVQINEPDEKSIYQVIDSISLNEDSFWRGKIQLNKNLNTIIGGRSTGKSTLLKGIVAQIDESKLPREETFARNHKDGLSITWCDNDTSFRRDIEYFSQNYMHSIASNEKLTNEIIEDIIRHKDKGEHLLNYESLVDTIRQYMAENVFMLFQKQKQINDLAQLLREKGNRDGVIQQLAILNSRLLELQRNSILTEEEKKQYDNLELQLIEKRKILAQMESDITILQAMVMTTPFNLKYFETWHLNELTWGINPTEIYRLYSNLVVKTEKEWSAIVKNFLDRTLVAKKSLEEEINIILTQDTYLKGVSAFKGNREIQDVKELIKYEQNKLVEIDKLLKEKEILETKKNEEIDSIISKHLDIIKYSNDVAEHLKFRYDGLDVGVEVLYHQEEMYRFLENRLNQKGFERQEYIQNLSRQYNLDTELYAKDFLRKLLLDEIVLKNGNESSNVATEFLSKKWYSLNYKLTYQGDAFVDMSEGKQAFVILKLLLDFSEKKCPILIDQPEDSLDNRAIYNELVTYIKKKKRERQIILVTHNSNVVVSADAENVIVANQDGINCHNQYGDKFQYINGALETTKDKDENEKYVLLSQGIREHVCEILEGGEDAFIKRERKYGFK